MHYNLNELPYWLLIVIFVLLFAQATFLFIHARRNGRMHWFWGIWGMISAPMPIIIYLIYIKVFIPYRQRRNSNA
ncbi:hypothetical protein [Geomicrobium sp. JCM 19038]|uniref:hypothetical protein n=1 Tax=Geomicrobium sp. JCM 19038 TaxID=1460635 RepID=UPI0005A871DC|nr:hypothetical protein [Geomicrobium sp. JCM 19038]